MGRGGSILAAAALGLSGGVGGYLLYDLTRDPAPLNTAADAPVAAGRLVGQPRPGFELADLEGERRVLDEWNGKVVVLNFWATWCPPCRREIPAFIELQEEYGAAGLQIVGVAIDQQELVQPYVDSMGVNYPVLVGELEAMEVGRAYGNHYGQLPYTVVIDRQGAIRAVHRGELEREQAARLIEPLL